MGGSTVATPDLSVVIPTLGRPTLDEQLHALARCRWDRPWEVVLADNAGGTAVADAARRWAGPLPRIRRVDASDRRGRSHAVNVGARAARGRWLLYVDDDDLVEADIVAAVGDAFAEGARAVVFNLDVRTINPPEVWRSSPMAQATESGRPTFRDLPAVWGCAGVERALFLDLGGFDEDLPYAEDLDFTVRLRDAGIVPTYLPRQLVHYRLRGDLRGRYRTRLAVAGALAEISRRHPDVVAPPSGGRWRRLGHDLVSAMRLAPGARHRTGRLLLADRLGDAAGRFRAWGGGR
ncbi:MAG: glycosyltransferase family 2 protein [Acidimicrobiales bacterium]|nr:glycosyltransferase family 2 protein [Acidimicrobiales bacterium]